MELALSLAIGIGLAAACGFRIFVPMLVMSIAARAEYLHLAGDFEWIGSTTALVCFASATALEIGAYYVPWLDNLLDTLAVPSSVTAGTIATASQVVTDVHPLLGWSLAIVAGGGAAGGVQIMTTAARGVSSLATGGLGNPLVSTIEAGSSIVFSILAILAPLVAVVGIVILLYFAIAWLARRGRTPEPRAS